MLAITIGHINHKVVPVSLKLPVNPTILKNKLEEAGYTEKDYYIESHDTVLKLDIDIFTDIFKLNTVLMAIAPLVKNEEMKTILGL